MLSGTKAKISSYVAGRQWSHTHGKNPTNCLSTVYGSLSSLCILFFDALYAIWIIPELLLRWNETLRSKRVWPPSFHFRENCIESIFFYPVTIVKQPKCDAWRAYTFCILRNHTHTNPSLIREFAKCAWTFRTLRFIAHFFVFFSSLSDEHVCAKMFASFEWSLSVPSWLQQNPLSVMENHLICILGRQKLPH